MRSFYTVLILILLVNINGIAQTKENQNPKVSIFNVITETFPDLINGDIDWGDFNQDGLMDFVMCGSDGSTLYSTVYKNNGDSTFTDITAGLTPIQQGITRWVDFNNDGYLDILISGNSGSFITELYSNNGDETFSMVYNSFTGLYVCDAVWADFNNDGWQDLVIAGDDGSAKSLYYINNGDTTFTLQSDPFTDVQNADIEVLDYNKDGYKDVIITGSIGGVSSNPGTFLYSNNGDGTFTYMSGISFTGVTYGDVKCADFNADGFTDVFIIGSNPGGRMAELYKNNGDSTFTKETTTTFEGIIHGYIALADWDNDGDIDIHYNGSTTSLGLRSYFYSNDGDFSFSEDYNWIEPLANSAGQWADFNNNGKQDILILGLDGVSAKKTYFYSSGGSGASDSWATNTAPAVAHHLTMEQDGCGMVTLKWDGGTDNENTDTLNSCSLPLLI